MTTEHAVHAEATSRQEHEERERHRRRLGKLRGKPVSKKKKRKLSSHDRRWIKR